MYHHQANANEKDNSFIEFLNLLWKYAFVENKLIVESLSRSRQGITEVAFLHGKSRLVVSTFLLQIHTELCSHWQREHSENFDKTHNLWVLHYSRTYYHSNRNLFSIATAYI